MQPRMTDSKQGNTCVNTTKRILRGASMKCLFLVLLITVQDARADKISVQDLMDHQSILRTESFCGFMEQLLPQLRRRGFTEQQIRVLGPAIKKVREFSERNYVQLLAIRDAGPNIPQGEARKIRDDLTRDWKKLDDDLRMVFERVSTKKSNRLVMDFQMETPTAYMHHPPLADMLDLEPLQREEIHKYQVQKQQAFKRISREFKDGKGEGTKYAKDKAVIYAYFYKAYGVLNDEQLIKIIPLTRKTRNPPDSASEFVKFIAKDEYKDDFLKLPRIKKMWDAEMAKAEVE